MHYATLDIPVSPISVHVSVLHLKHAYFYFARGGVGKSNVETCSVGTVSHHACSNRQKSHGTENNGCYQTFSLQKTSPFEINESKMQFASRVFPNLR